MDQVQYTTNEHKKGAHLTYEERVLIQTRLKDGWSANRIAKEIGCASNTVRNEIRRGTVRLYNGKVERYKASAGQEAYEHNRENSVRPYDRLKKSAFIAYVERHVSEDGWSLDACAGRAIEAEEFDRSDTLCTKTLYNYVSLGLIGIKSIDLPERVSRRQHKKRNRENKRILGRSIEDRDPSINTREEFGHWECDLVIGEKSGDKALLTLLERKSREFLTIGIKSKEVSSVMDAFDELRSIYSEHFSDVFKTVTTDNGSEFSRLSELEKLAGTLVYFAHPYTSCEKGSVENHNRLIRRFIPKGKRIADYTPQQIADIETWCNSLPRKILSYKTPDEVFESELDRIYGKAS